ncbi:MAG: sensor domain-containing diguanylate cyclase [Rhodoferax sp.]
MSTSAPNSYDPERRGHSRCAGIAEYAPMNQQNRLLTLIRRRPVAALTLLLLILLAGMAAAFWQSQHIAMDRVEATLDRSSISRRNLLQRDVQNPLLVPEVLAASKTVRTLLLQPSSLLAREESQELEEAARNTRTDAVYVMDLSGNCLAASNWRSPDSFVGKNYRFRPYFTQALAGQTGRYVAKGVTSSKVGYYLSRPVTVEGSIVGAVVAKVSFDNLQSRIDEFWKDDAELNLIADENGVVFVSPLSTFVFKSVETIAEVTRKEIEASRQYGGDLVGISLAPGRLLAERFRFVDFVDLPGQSFLQKAYYFPDLKLRLYLHLPASIYWGTVIEFTAMFSLLALAILLVCITLFQRSVYSARLIEAAIRDPLTLLHTRLYMSDWCHSAIRAHNRDPHAGFGLVVFDLDLFKRVNDSYGHLAGDDVLRGVGRIISAAIRGRDLAVRFGGEELAVFVQCADLTEVVALAERIRMGVEQAEFRSNGERIPVTLSGGAAYHFAGETLDALFARADAKLYEAKESGRNRIVD